jgi:Protein of unknown function (DUF3631)
MRNALRNIFIASRLRCRSRSYPALVLARRITARMFRTGLISATSWKRSDLRTVFGDHDAMASKLILASLQQLTESPWHDLKGKPLDERGLSHRLRQYGVRPRTVRTGASTARGYMRADLCDVWERYLPPSPDRSNTSNTRNTTQVNQADVVSDVSDGTSFVSDSGSGMSDDVSEIHQKNDRKNNNVSDVLDVLDLSGHGGEHRACAQCGGPDDGQLEQVGGVFVHPECRRFWNQADDELSIPEFLRR